MKHLSAFFRPVTNALSAWSVGLHSFFSHLLISAGSLPQRNVSVTSASAAIVGTPSRRRRGLMLKPLALMLLFLLGSLNVWGDSPVQSTFSKNSTISNNQVTEGGVTWTINTGTKTGSPAAPAGANFQKRAGLKFGDSGSKYYKPVTFTTSYFDDYNVTAVEVYICNNGNKAGTLTVTQGSTQIGTQTETFGTTWTVLKAETQSGNGGALSISYSVDQAFCINYIKVTYTGPGNPAVSVKQGSTEITALDFTTVGVGDDAPAAKTFTITGSNMTAALSIADLTNFDYSVTSGSLSPSEGSISATVTVTPKSGFTTNAEDKSETLKISGDDLDNDIELALNAEVKAKHNIIFDTDLKSIANVSVIEGEIYDITETIEAASIASCTYTKFEGWTTTTSIADANTKPSLVGSVTMDEADITLKPVFSKTIGGGGATNETASVTISEYATNNSWDNGTQYTSVELDENITATASSGTNTGKYYTDGGEWRFYSSESATITINAAAGCTLTSITPTFNVKSNGVLKDGETTLNSGETYPISGTSKTFTIGVGQVKFTIISVTYEKSGGGTTTYSLDPGCAAAGQCYAPTFSPAAGTFDVAQNVELACATDGADIYYTLNGETPTSSSTKYTSAIPVTQNRIIKAIAIKDGMTDSEIAEGEFNIRYAQPTFSPVGGEYDVEQNVTISAAGADHIYYTLNGNDPVPGEEGTSEYIAAISINTTGSHTIKAIAVKDGYANSNVVSATYVMDLPYGSIAEFVTAKPNTAKDLVFEAEDNCIITGINGTTIYVQDASGKGIMIYGLASLPTNAAVNHQITGTINAKYTLFKGQHEMTNVNFNGASISKDPVSRPTPAAVTAIDATNFDAHTMVLVSIENLYYKSSDNKTHMFATTEGGSTEYTIYDQFGMLSGKTMPETSVACNLTGILSVFNTTYQLLPVFATDIVADADAAAPIFNPDGGADAESAIMVDFNSDVTISAADANHTVDITTARINTTDPMSVTVTSSRDFYRPTSVTKWYKGNPASITYDINGLGDLTGGSVTAQVSDADAAVAAEDAVVTLLVDVAAHHTFTSISVVDADESPITLTEVTAGEKYTFSMPAKAVTVSAVFTEDQKYALTFTAGEGSGDAPAISGNSYYEGEAITLPANTFTYDAQHKFTKWLIGGTEYAAGASYTMPAEATEVVAQWKTIPAFASGDWVLVKDADELTEGSYVIIAASDAAKAMGSYVSGNNCPGKDATKGETLTYSNQFAIFEIGDYEIDEVTYKTFFDVDVEKYLFLSSNDNHLKAQTNKNENAAWTITSVNSESGLAVVSSKSYPDRSMRYNGNGSSNLFACYGSNNTNQKHIVLYKYEEHKFTLTYNKNIEAEVSGMPEAQRANEENKVTVSTDVPTCGSKIFMGWNTQTGGEGETKAANTVLTLSDDLTLFAQWRDAEEYTVSYNANGGEGTMEDDADQTEGSQYTIKANEFTREGYLFAGWKAYNASDEELTISNGKIIIPASDVTIKAQWQSATDSKWVLVEHLSQLADGDKVIIAAAGYDYALGAEAGSTSKYRAREAANKAGKLLIPTAGATQLTLGKSGDYYTFKDGDNYLMWSSGNTLPTEASVSDNSLWTISFEEGVMHIVNKKDENRQIQYNDNGGQERFATYIGTQAAVVIYKFLDIDPEDATTGYERTDLILSGIGTICLPYDVKASDRFGGVFYMPSHKTSGFANFIEETGTLRAGKAYIFVAENEFIRLKYSGDEALAPLSEPEDTRGLIGTFDYIAPGNLTHKYVIANNKLMECGSGAYLNAYRAYLDLGAMPTTELVINEPVNAPARRRLGIGGGASGVTTDIEDVQGDSLSGIKVLLNGQLFIIRGEKMYDATGRLVK